MIHSTHPELFVAPIFPDQSKTIHPETSVMDIILFFFSIPNCFVVIDLNYLNWFHWKIPFGSRNSHYAVDVWYLIPFSIWWPFLRTQNYLLPQYFPINKRLPYLPLYTTHPCIILTPKFQTKFWEKKKNTYLGNIKFRITFWYLNMYVSQKFPQISLYMFTTSCESFKSFEEVGIKFFN